MSGVRGLRVAISPSSFADQDPGPLRLLESAGVEIIPNPYGRRLTEDEAILHLRGVHGLIAGVEPLTRRVLESARDLRALARVGSGMDSVDLTAAAELGIRVTNTPEGPTDAVAELTLTAALSILRGIVPMNAALHERRWQKQIGGSLAGARVLIVGYGRIGRRFAVLARACGGEIGVVDPLLSAEQLDGDERLFALYDGLAWADVVSVHASGRETILGAAELAILHDGAVILNAARGGLIDEDALVQELNAGRFRGVWLDVFPAEPYSGVLCGMPGVLLTPHVGTYTARCRRDMETAAVTNVLRDLGLAAVQSTVHP